MSNLLHEKLKSTGEPKRILSLDGGGARGILTLGILKKIETIVRDRSGNPGLLLGDYYDLIGGTSTGAIIACGLAIGKTVDEIIQLYLTLGDEIFVKGRRKKLLKRDWTTLRAIFSENYSSEYLEKYLTNVFGDITLGDSEKIRCGLAINSKRADTYSLWTVANHPGGMYYGANSHLKLSDLCRASSAAPYYFKPKKLTLKTRSGQSFGATFIDGGVSLANNPAWQTFLVSTTPSFGFKWTAGKDRILITTLGTGNGQTKDDPDQLEKMRTIQWAPKLSDLFMVDALEMNHIILEILGHNVGSRFSVDSQFKDLSDITLMKEENKLFSFQRHNVILTASGLAEIGLAYPEDKIASLKEMDHSENMEELLKIGEAYAEKNIQVIL